MESSFAVFSSVYSIYEYLLWISQSGAKDYDDKKPSLDGILAIQKSKIKLP